jgi:hypothetical protein
LNGKRRDQPAGLKLLARLLPGDNANAPRPARRVTAMAEIARIYGDCRHSLALGTGATTAIFTLVQQVMLATKEKSERLDRHNE